jgi:ABC-2 type transport system permease protein
MNKILTIIQREYVTRVRRKVFVITTLLLPLGFAAIFFVPLLISNYSSEIVKIAIVDESGIFKNKFADHKNLLYKNIDLPYEQVKKTYMYAYNGILHIPVNFDIYKPSGIELYSDKQMGFLIQENIGDDLTKVVRDIKLAKLNVKQDSLDNADKAVTFDSIIKGEGGEKKGNTGMATAMGYIMGFFIYFVMFIYGAMVLRGVMEEKTNRISEVIISSVKPFQLMMGKIIGVGLVGLTQFFIWIILITSTLSLLGVVFHDQLMAMHNNNAGATYSGQGSSSQLVQAVSTINDSVNNLPMGEIIFCFLFYFFGGYLLYSALFAAVGSAAGDDPGDTQSLNLVVTLPIAFSMIIMINVLQQPNSQFAVVTSLIPFFTPVIMSARLPFGVPMWQIALSMVDLVIGFLFTTWLAGKIYRTGILMYGKKVTFKELGKWLFYKN